MSKGKEIKEPQTTEEKLQIIENVKIMTNEFSNFMDNEEEDVILSIEEADDGSFDVDINVKFHDMFTEKYPDIDFKTTFSELLSYTLDAFVNELESKETSDDTEK